MKVKELTREEIVRVLKAEKDTLKKYKVKRIGLFGSYVRGDENKSSDIDLIVEFDQPYFEGIFHAFMELSDYLENLFGKKVDILTPDGMSPYIRPYIEREIKWHET